jgi:hypothetical protein
MSDVYGAPAEKAATVTPSDVTVVNFRALYVGGAGDLVVVMRGDASNTPVTFPSVPAGAILPIAVKQVRAATGASSIVGLV